jgi:hypothetical protein
VQGLKLDAEGETALASGIRSLGFETLKAPAAIKRMWVVSTPRASS